MVVSDTGWVEQPAIRDMAKIQFGQSHLEIAGTTVPIAEFTLALERHHLLLPPRAAVDRSGLPNWMTTMWMAGAAWNRKLAGMPLVMMEASGPGHIALSDNHAGEVIALPLQAGQHMWVREHRFLCATGRINYTWHNTGVYYETGTGDDREYNYPMGQFGDVFTAQGGPGLLLLHSPGNTFIRDLGPRRERS